MTAKVLTRLVQWQMALAIDTIFCDWLTEDGATSYEHQV